MDFARQQRDPTRHLIGIAFVVLIHAIVIYALVTGLARKAIEVIKKPLSATIIEEIKAPPPPPPPPPPPKKIVEPPKIVTPYVPPPDVPVPTQTTEPVISAVTAAPPTEPVVIAPPAPPVVAPPAPPPPKPAIRRGAVPIERVEPVYPREAIRDNIASGKVVARLQVNEKGLVTEVTIVESNPRRVFDREVVRALSQWKFQPEGDKYIAEIEINFVLQ